MKQPPKKKMVITYDKNTGRIVSTHRTVSLDKDATYSDKELIKQAKAFTQNISTLAAGKSESQLVEMPDKDISNLLAMNPETKRPALLRVKSKNKRNS